MAAADFGMMSSALQYARYTIISHVFLSLCMAAADFGMMSSAPQYARYAIISHVTHLVNRDYDVRLPFIFFPACIPNAVRLGHAP